jgi:multiple sugar transport system ATP-binding protein
MAGVTFDHVRKDYGGTVVIRDFSLEIADGEFLVLVGPSGCGKSTALRMIAGLEEVTAGRLLIGDRVVNHLAPGDRDVAMVFQSYALYPHMTVYDNLAFGLRNVRMAAAEIDRRVAEATRMLDLGGLLARKPKQLSGGQRQRVALGRAIVRDPAVFLMDEPLSNLDAKLRVATRAEILKLHQRVGTTFIYVTHDQVEAMTMGSRIAVLDAGELQQVGTPEELYTQPANLFVAGFIGSPSMNLLTVTAAPAGADAGDAGGRLLAGGLRIEADPGLAAVVAEHGSLVAGFRPEFLETSLRGRPAAATMTGTVEVVEYLGDELLVHLAAGDTAYVARLTVADTRPAPGDSLTLSVPAGRFILFDPDDQQRVDPAPHSRAEAVSRRTG